ncbi:PQQ-dependent sugar dehydrogenase [Gangjinia marincola]|uniref:PQQ-dependent sugar dehydrogenase n=1 Tax=Gangjinia marincola TaxID=578463 RepID=A0ABP3XYR7_9FLAO
MIACAQREKENDVPLTTANYDHEIVVDGLNIPWGMTFLPNGDLLVTEKTGELIRFDGQKKAMITGVPQVYVRGQGGLLDIALHPDYKNNGWLYLTYASDDGEEKGGHTALMRAKLENNTLVEKEVLYKASPNTTKGQHFGSRIVFDNKGYLYFSIGERGARDVNPQDITRDGGKIYRLNDDGSIPKDNPFYDQADAKKAIYSYGHRNPQGMDKHPESGKIWLHEHGPRGGDEINIVEKGENYGWPVITYGINYSGTEITDQTSKPGMQQPIYYWIPSIAPSGMTFVTSSKYPQLQGNLLVGSLKFEYLEHVVLKGQQVTKREKLLEGIGRVRSVIQGPDGFVYVGVEGTGIVKLIPKK